jgi:hypothetical protein
MEDEVCDYVVEDLVKHFLVEILLLRRKSLKWADQLLFSQKL